jgi:hypothetical protein
VRILLKTEVWQPIRQARPSRVGDLTHEEQQNVRRALGFLRSKLGSGTKLAKALNVHPTMLEKMIPLTGRSKPQAGLALRAARLAGVPVEDLLSGAWPPDGQCPYCGRF